MASSDLLMVVPWVVFGVALGLIAIRLLRRRGRR
jgi:hypothetical protein